MLILITRAVQPLIVSRYRSRPLAHNHRLAYTDVCRQPLVLTWAVNNQGGALKRGCGTAIVVSMGNAGGIISSL